MAPTFPQTKITLDYPLYCSDFDPQDPNRLIVGGGGGATRSGVGNRITVLEATHEHIQRTSQVELSRDEDNVTTIAVAQRRLDGGKANLVLAGINSSAADQAKGKNEHLRPFSAYLPSPKFSKAEKEPYLSELSRTALFTSDAGTDAYQRTLRLSAPFAGVSSGTQLGAVSTGTAKESQIALFDVPAQGPNLVPRGVISLKKEANDLDLIQVAENNYQLIYCEDNDLYTIDISKGSVGVPQYIYTVPDEESTGKLPTLRCIRYLTPTFAVGVANQPNSSGISLYGFRLPKTGAQGSKARIATNNRLPKNRGGAVKATGLAVANITPRTTPSSRQGDSQFVVAIAMNDFSVIVYTLDHSVAGEVELIANVNILTTFKGMHAGMITSLSFAQFTPPAKTTGRVQALRLASTSVSNEVCVHEIPLKKLFDRSASSTSTQRKGGPPRQARYIVAAKSKSMTSPIPLIFLLAIITLALAVFIQGVFFTVHDPTQPIIFNPWRRNTLSDARPHFLPPKESGALADLLAKNKLENGNNAVVLNAVALPDGENGGGERKLTVETHDEEVHGGKALKWEDMSKAQREAWKAYMKETGEWAEDMPSTIFKGVLFSELAGVVGAMIG